MAKLYYGIDNLQNPDGTYTKYICYSNTEFSTTLGYCWEYDPETWIEDLPSWSRKAVLVTGDFPGNYCDIDHKLILPENVAYLFYGCTNTSYADMNREFDVRFIDFSYVIDANHMFASSKLEDLLIGSDNNFAPFNIEGLCADCTNLETADISVSSSNVISNISHMFDNCTSLTTVNFNDTFYNSGTKSSVEYLYNNCSSLTSASLNFNLDSTARSLSHILNGCTSLTSFSSSFNTDNIEDFESCFQNCKSLEKINIRNWNFRNAKNISSLFCGCDNLETIELPAGNIGSNIESTSQAFKDCPSLKYIYAPKYTDWNVSLTSDSTDMFTGSTQLPDFDSEEVQIMSANNRKNDYWPSYFIYHTYWNSDAYIKYAGVWYKIIIASRKTDGAWVPISLFYYRTDDNI